MTLVEVTYDLESPLSQEQLCSLGEFANTYGLRRISVDESNRQVTIEYDASRLRETQIAHVLGLAGISIAQVLETSGAAADPLPLGKASLPR